MGETISHEPADECCPGNRLSQGKVHLPVAPKAQARVRFSPETPLPRALSPEQALGWLDYLEGEGWRIRVTNLNGPGDPLATPELTIQTLAALRERRPELSICLTTLGLGAGPLAVQLAAHHLTHVSLLMDAVALEVAERIYAWIRRGTRTLPLREAAAMLVEEQAEAIASLTRAGIAVQVKTTVYAGINSEHIGAIAQRAAELGAAEMKLFPFVAKDDDHPRPTRQTGAEELTDLARAAGEFLPARFIDPASCRDELVWGQGDAEPQDTPLPKPTRQRPHLAVCSSDGFRVDLHLGQAERYLVYGRQDGPVVLLEARPAPEPGGGEARWRETALALGDCFAVLCAAAGEVPKRVLGENGLAVLAREGNVESLVDVLYGGGKKKGGKKP